MNSEVPNPNPLERLREDVELYMLDVIFSGEGEVVAARKRESAFYTQVMWSDSSLTLGLFFSSMRAMRKDIRRSWSETEHS